VLHALQSTRIAIMLPFGLRVCALLVVMFVCQAHSFRYITYVTAGGNNNVRNSFYGALEVAWLAQQKMNVKPWIVAPRDPRTHTAADMLTVFNLARLERKANIVAVPYGNLSSKDMSLAEADWNNGRCHFSCELPEQWIAKFESFKRDNVCQHGFKYVHGWEDSAGRYDKQWQSLGIRQLYSATRFRDSIMQFGEALRQLMPSDYIAAHYRAGDKTPIPLLNCSKYGLSRAGLRSGACTHRHDYLRAIVSYEEVLLDLWRLKAPGTVYVATHAFDDDRLHLFTDTLSNSGFEVVGLAALKKKLPQPVHQRLMEINSDVAFLESWIDQYLTSEAALFLPCATSTWSQFVLIIRRELEKKDSEEWVQLYAEACAMYGADATHYQYYDGGEGSQVVPNFMTRCPVGTSVSGKHCLCNNADAQCILMPKLPTPQGNKGCLSSRRFSPLTFRRSNGFHSECIACRCDPFDGIN
jgi:hypothetical protein